MIRAFILSAVVTLMCVGSAHAAKKGAQHFPILGCQAVDADGTVFFDPNARGQITVTPSGNENLQCEGNLPLDAVPPAAPVTFDQNSGTALLCLARWEETIQLYGTFSLTCHLRHGEEVPVPPVQ